MKKKLLVISLVGFGITLALGATVAEIKPLYGERAEELVPLQMERVAEIERQKEQMEEEGRAPVPSEDVFKVDQDKERVVAASGYSFAYPSGFTLGEGGSERNPITFSRSEGHVIGVYEDTAPEDPSLEQWIRRRFGESIQFVGAVQLGNLEGAKYEGTIISSKSTFVFFERGDSYIQVEYAAPASEGGRFKAEFEGFLSEIVAAN